MTTVHRRPFVAAAVVALLVTAAGCASSPVGPEATSTPAPTTPPPTVEQAPTATRTTPTGAGPTGEEWTMPDLTGMDLQDAQDRLQRETDYGVPFSTSTDATGAGRQQVLDRNWVVCAQDPPPGATLRTGDVPNLAVVKDDESCG